MNHDEAAREIDLALFVGIDHQNITPAQRRIIIAAKLRELGAFPKVPKDLETAVREAANKHKSLLGIQYISCMEDDNSLSPALDVPGEFIDIILDAAEPFCQKPEVPADLEAAVQGVLDHWINSNVDGVLLPDHYKDAILKDLLSTVAPLLAERDERNEN